MNIFNEFINDLVKEDLIENSETISESLEEDSQSISEDELIDNRVNFIDADFSDDSDVFESESKDFAVEEFSQQYVQAEDSEEISQITAQFAEDSEITAEPIRDAFDENEVFSSENRTNSNEEFDTVSFQIEKDEMSSAEFHEQQNFETKTDQDFSIVEEKIETAAASGYFRKRAMDEVSFLQMVENIFSGIERQQMKIVPKPYNEIPVKKALHNFLQITEDVDSPEHAQSEFHLLQETESWYSALSHRDKHISVANLRLYCETTRPPLSSPALVSLARFYRNLPYSEAARNKFDLIVTRLFSKDVKSNKREILFHRDELIEHFKGLYKEWESISIYSSDEDDSEILLTAIKFEEFTTEAEEAENFDQLIESDFFNRLRVFKKSVNENFFAPLLCATAVETNIRIGNRYVELLEKERGKENASIIEEKYGFLHDQTISDTTSKTLELVELLKGRASEPREQTDLQALENKTESTEEAEQKTEEAVSQPPQTKDSQNGIFSGFFSVNKWLLIATIFSIVISFGLYLWAEQKTGGAADNSNIEVVNLDNSPLKSYLKTARITKNTFYAVTLPEWNKITPDQKKDLLNKVMAIGGDKGFKSIHLLDDKGKTVGYASADKVKISSP